MNIRIQKLAEQATDVIEIVNPDTGVTHSREFFDKEKFAKLIIIECAGLFPNVYVSLETEWGHTPVIAEDYIKNYFGVEE